MPYFIDTMHLYSIVDFNGKKIEYTVEEENAMERKSPANILVSVTDLELAGITSFIYKEACSVSN